MTNEQRHPPFPTSEELKELIEDREKDLDKLELKYTPRWQMDLDDEVWRQARLRERKITRMTTRLDKATRQFENDFDRQS